MSLKKGDFVKVTWLDPQTNAGWIEERCDLEPVVTIGFFIEESDTTLWLASTYHNGTENYADEMIFPKGCIVLKEKLLT